MADRDTDVPGRSIPPASPSRPPATPSPRLWPGLAILALQAFLLAVSVWPVVANAPRFFVMVLGPTACALFFAAWILFASRLPRREGAKLLGWWFVGGALVAAVAHTSTRISVWVHGLPLAMALVFLGVVVFGRRRGPARWRAIAACGGIAFLPFLLLRLDGFDGAYFPEWSFRFAPTAEDRFARVSGPDAGPDIRRDDGIAPAPDLELDPLPGDWTGFRGPARDGRVLATPPISLDWKADPPRELWRIPVGPGWSSFACVRGRLYTLEQRGPDEMLVTYDAETGRELSRVGYRTRFSDVVAGPGPRSTPTYANGRLFGFGAEATLFAADARSGEIVWRRDLVEEIGALLPVWGFSGSPLVTEGAVVVYADGTEGRGLVAYAEADGAPLWHVGGSGMNFASAHPATLDGRNVVLFTRGDGVLAVDPRSGDVLWRYEPTTWKAPPLIQPRVLADDGSLGGGLLGGGLLVATGDGHGLARIDVRRDARGACSFDEVWTSRRLRPSFNDFVVHEGHVYGFSQHVFASLDAADGSRNWTLGRYGFGQALLLARSDAILLVSETGDLVLAAADPDEPRELGRVAALSGKTWNHPIVVGNRLFLRNGEEAVAYQLALAPAVSKSRD